MQTITATATERLNRKGQRPIYRVDIGDDPGAALPVSTGWIASFTLAASRIQAPLIVDAPPLVLEINGIGQALDVVTGSFDLSAKTVVLQDCDVVRELAANNNLIGKDLAIFRGYDDTGFAYADWIPYWRGTIDDIHFSEDGLAVSAAPLSAANLTTMGQVRAARDQVPVVPGAAVVISTETVTDAVAYNAVGAPVQMMADLLAISGLPARFIDANSFSVAHAQNDWISHLRTSVAVTHQKDTRITSGTPIMDLIQNLSWLLRAFVFWSEDGKLTMRELDTSGAAIVEWGDDEITAGPEEVRLGQEDITTSIIVNSAYIGAEDELRAWIETKHPSAYLVQLRIDEDTAAGDFGHAQDGTEPIARETEFGDNWFGAAGDLLITTVADNPITVTPALTPHVIINGVVTDPEGAFFDVSSANDFDWPGLGATVASAVDATHPVYCALVDPDTGSYAIVKYESVTHPAGSEIIQLGTPTFIDGDNTVTGYVRIYDVTAAWLKSDQLLSLFSGSASKYTLRTHGSELIYQIGDIVSIDTGMFVDIGKTGSAAALKFLIIAKDHEIESDELTWTLLRINSVSPTITVDNTMIGWKEIGRPWSFFDENSLPGFSGKHPDTGFEDVPVQGLLGAVSASLKHTIPSGYALMRGGAALSGPLTHTYTASKDTWCYVRRFHRRSGLLEWQFVEVANGAAQPATPAECKPIQRVRTSGAAITEVLDFRERGVVGKKGLTTSEQLGTWRLESMHPSTIDGLDLSVTGGSLTETISAGIVHSNGKRARRPQDEIVTLTASRIAFFDVDEDGVLAVTEVALGSDEPILATDSTRIGVAITNGAGVKNWFKFPMERPVSSGALNPQAVRDGFAPNGMLDDYDVDTGKPMGWDWTQGANAVLSVVTSAVKAGRYGAEANIKSTATQSDIWSDVFPIATLGTYTLDVIYSTTGYVRGPYANIGWEFFDRYGVSLGTRFLVITVASGPVPVDVTNQGALLTGTWAGVGAGANQIPDLARYARWWIELTANVAGDAGVTLSMCMTKP